MLKFRQVGLHPRNARNLYQGKSLLQAPRGLHMPRSFADLRPICRLSRNLSMPCSRLLQEPVHMNGPFFRFLAVTARRLLDPGLLARNMPVPPKPVAIESKVLVGFGVAFVAALVAGFALYQRGAMVIIFSAFAIQFVVLGLIYLLVRL